MLSTRPLRRDSAPTTVFPPPLVVFENVTVDADPAARAAIVTGTRTRAPGAQSRTGA